MKIYINNFNLYALKDVQELLKELLINSVYYIQLYTNEGIYHIEKKNIYNLEIIDKDVKIYEKYSGDFTIIVDSSYFNRVKTSSINGIDHLNMHIRKDNYKLNKNSQLTLVIENQSQIDQYTPIDIYFELNDNNINVNELFFKKEIIEFLSLLN